MSSDKPTVVVTGSNGLIGSKLVADYGEQYDFRPLDISHPTNPIDLTDAEAATAYITSINPTAIVHFAAFTDVTGAWKQRGQTDGLAYQVNVTGTKHLLEAAARVEAHLVHISTAYVFDGEKDGLYTEEDPINPIEWYGQTKAEAEALVLSSALPSTVLRIDQPFRSDAHEKPDIARRIIAGLRDDSLYPQFTNHYFGPTFIDDLSRVLDWALRSTTTGLFHASSGEQWTDYEFAKLINETHDLSGTVEQGDLEDYLQTLERPYQRNTAMDTSKLEEVLDFELRSIEAAVAEIEL